MGRKTSSWMYWSRRLDASRTPTTFARTSSGDGSNPLPDRSTDVERSMPWPPPRRRRGLVDQLFTADAGVALLRDVPWAEPALTASQRVIAESAWERELRSLMRR
mmetsp:Transcript_4726/g.14309  ORF Transcript_4726/g.14309 Transcript_4726/m.14309 type:complete len:105 (-) Transcript_4726:57-371(-)